MCRFRLCAILAAPGGATAVAVRLKDRARIEDARLLMSDRAGAAYDLSDSFQGYSAIPGLTGVVHPRLQPDRIVLPGALLFMARLLVCLMPARLILIGQPWHLCHDRETGKYLGPGHVKCNTSEGGKAAHSV